MSPASVADVVATVPGIPSTKGVVMNPPPASILEAVTKQVRDAVATLPPDGHGAIVGIATTAGVNLAVVQRLGTHVESVAWIGRTWGQPIEAGAAVRVHW